MGQKGIFYCGVAVLAPSHPARPRKRQTSKANFDRYSPKPHDFVLSLYHCDPSSCQKLKVYISALYLRWGGGKQMKYLKHKKESWYVPLSCEKFLPTATLTILWIAREKSPYTWLAACTSLANNSQRADSGRLNIGDPNSWFSSSDIRLVGQARGLLATD